MVLIFLWVPCVQADTGESVAALVAAGWNSYSKEELTEAQDHFKKAVDLEPGNTEALMGLGMTSM